DLAGAEIFKCKRQLVTDLLVHGSRNADPAGRGHRLEPDGDDDSVAVDITALHDNIAEIDADAERDAPIVSDTVVRCLHALLHLARAGDCVDRATELDHHAIAHHLDDAAVMLGNQRIEDLPATLP